MKIILCLILIIELLLSVSKSKSDNFEFTTPDIVVETSINGTRSRLEAFKTTLNDLIIFNKTKEEYSRLHWVSIGIPRLLPTYISATDTYELFVWHKTGFYTLIETLADAHKELLRQKIEK